VQPPAATRAREAATDGARPTTGEEPSATVGEGSAPGSVLMTAPGGGTHSAPEASWVPASAPGPTSAIALGDLVAVLVEDEGVVGPLLGVLLAPGGGVGGAPLAGAVPAHDDVLLVGAARAHPGDLGPGHQVGQQRQVGDHRGPLGDGGDDLAGDGHPMRLGSLRLVGLLGLGAERVELLVGGLPQREVGTGQDPGGHNDEDARRNHEAVPQRHREPGGEGCRVPAGTVDVGLVGSGALAGLSARRNNRLGLVHHLSRAEVQQGAQVHEVGDGTRREPVEQVRHPRLPYTDGLSDRADRQPPLGDLTGDACDRLGFDLINHVLAPHGTQVSATADTPTSRALDNVRRSGR